VSREVRAIGLGQSALCAFLGTSAAFGAFDASTRLVTADGSGPTVADIIEAGRIRDFSFETHTTLPRIARIGDSVAALWSTLAASAAAVGPSSVALRRRDDLWKPDGETAFLKEASFGNQKYCIVDKAGFATELSSDWPSSLVRLARLWSFDSQEKRLELERRAYPIGLWYVSASRATGLSCRLRYDSQQHTAVIFVEDVETELLPTQPGATAFFAPAAMTQVIELAWDDRSWNPLSSGFIVAAG
jgi:hypothetical protein